MAVVRPPKWKRPLPVPVSYSVPSERSSPRVAAAFAAGCGGVITEKNELVRGVPLAIFGSPARSDLLKEHIATGQDWYYVDHAYFRRGARIYRIARNRYQSLVNVHDLPRAPSGRWAKLRVTAQPGWNKGSSILICPNSPAYMAWFGLDAKQWALDVAAQLTQYTDRPIVIRWKASADVRPFYADAHDAHATVVFSSGAAVESLTLGVPVFVLADWASTAPMGLSDLSQIETPYYPDHREPFLWELANRQWPLDEIRAGVAWQWFMQREEETI